MPVCQEWSGWPYTDADTYWSPILIFSLISIMICNLFYKGGGGCKALILDLIVSVLKIFNCILNMLMVQ